MISPGFFRYNLRTLLLAMTVLCVWLGIQVNAARRQKEAVDAIRKAGGQVVYDYQWMPVPGVPYTWAVDLNAVPFEPSWLSKLIGMDYLHNAVSVTFLGGDMTEVDLALLAQLTKLRSATLCGTGIVGRGRDDRRSIRDADLAVFSHMGQLEYLNLAYADIDGSGLSRLAKLESINLSRTRFTDDTLPYLKNLTNLKHVELRGTRVTPEGIRELQKSLPNTTIVGPLNTLSH